MKSDRLTIIIEKGKKRIITQSPIHGIDRLVFVINHQFTNAPNTTQLASGAGRSSAAGSNAAIKSPHSQQQQSVGAGGKAKNRIGKGAKGKLSGVGSKQLAKIRRKGKEIIVVINDQIVKLPKHAANASATQVASGAGKYSTSGTNSAIESPGTKQQDAVGGNGKASNTLASKRRKKK
ncbi:hypothetical protein [Paenibacillus sp. LjRoot56]|uniref:hypothetical protein n=1 Tax=Paenibacillus sp. LjRoot56 TaxID=3342333 RepID=UPI003ECDADC4